MMIRWWEHGEKGVTNRRTDGQTDGRTENTICRAAWSQLKMKIQNSRIISSNTKQINYTICGPIITRSSLESCSTICLTHWGPVRHICVGKLTTIVSDIGLSPGRCQATIKTNAGILLIGPLETNLSEILIRIKKDFILERKCTCKCRLRNDVYFVSASMSQDNGLSIFWHQAIIWTRLTINMSSTELNQIMCKLLNSYSRNALIINNWIEVMFITPKR